MNVRSIAIVAGSSLLVPLCAKADGSGLHALALECEKLSEVKSRIEFCYDNREAVHSADKCYQMLVKAWDEAPRDLNPTLSSAHRQNAETRQRGEFINSHTDLSKTIEKLDNLLAITRRNADLVASYYKAMFDTHDMDDHEQTAPCFANNYKKLSAIVWKLDDRIIEGQRTRDRAESMRSTSQGRDDHIDSTTADILLHGLPEESSPYRPVPQGISRAPASDITGTQEIKRRESPQKDILNSFPARDQLTGP